MSIETATADSRLQYYRMQRQAQRQDLIARLRGKSNDLLPYEAIAHLLKSFEHKQLTEQRFIPLDKIVGSIGRYREFTREFLPRAGISFDRWAGINLAMTGASGVPPIEVYQLGDVYFVADGNHRVSVARANGLKEIAAYVTLLPGDPGLKPGDTLDQAIVKVECLQFLAQTRLTERCGELDIAFTKPGGFARLLEHIYAHAELLAVSDPAGRSPSFPVAAGDWYESVYLPIIGTIRERHLTRRFKGATASDLYVWIISELVQLSDLVKGEVLPAEAVDKLEADAPATFVRAVLNVVTRLGRATQERPTDGSGGQTG